MPIALNEIKLYQSTNNLGGQITANELVDNVTHNLFDLVDGSGSSLGETNYRCLYVKNANPSLTLLNAAIQLLTGTKVSTTDYYMGLGTSIIGGVEQSIVTELDTPIGVTFTNLIGADNKVIIGNIPKGSHKAVWFKRIIQAGTPGYTGDSSTVRVTGES